MVKNDKDDKIRVTVIPYDVKCILTEHEIREAGLRLANYYQEKETLVIEKKAALAEYKQKAERIDDKIHKTSMMISQGIETRKTDCEVTYDYNNNTVVVKRKDTGEVVDQRGMTNEEQQLQLFDDKGSKSKSSKNMSQQVKQDELDFEKAKASKKDKND